MPLNTGTTAVYLFPTRKPELMDDYSRLTGFTKDEIREMCAKAEAKGRMPAFEIDADEVTMDELKSLSCEISWTYVDPAMLYTRDVAVVDAE